MSSINWVTGPVQGGERGRCDIHYITHLVPVGQHKYRASTIYTVLVKAWDLEAEVHEASINLG